MSVLSHTTGICVRCAIDLHLSRATEDDPWLCDRCVYHEYSALRSAKERLEAQLSSTRADLREGWKTIAAIQDDNDRLRSTK